MRRDAPLDLVRHVGPELFNRLLVQAALDADVREHRVGVQGQDQRPREPEGVGLPLRGDRILVAVLEHQVDLPLGPVDDHPAAFRQVHRRGARRLLGLGDQQFLPAWFAGIRFVAGVQDPPGKSSKKTRGRMSLSIRLVMTSKVSSRKVWLASGMDTSIT